MGLLLLLVTAIELADLISNINDAGQSDPREVVLEALAEVEALIVDMCANEGQLSVIQSYGLIAFSDHTEMALVGKNFEWQDVDLGDYMDFVGEIIAEGNMIMQDACDRALEMQQEIEDLTNLDMSEDAEPDEAEGEE